MTVWTVLGVVKIQSNVKGWSEGGRHREKAWHRQRNKEKERYTQI